MSAHSKIPPSSAHRWGAPGGCPGWVSLSPQFPDNSGDAAREGTASHEIGAVLLKALRATMRTGEVETEDSVGPEREDIVGKLSEQDKIPYTVEMLEGAEFYAENVAKEALSQRPELFHIEERVHAPQIHADSWGSVDCWMYSLISRHLTLWDYKFGHGVVEIFENWQLINYAAGAISKLVACGLGVPQIITMRIVQPRAQHRGGKVREWTVTAAELQPYIDQLARGAAEAMNPDAPVRTGDHCKNCNALHSCPAAQKAAANLVDLADTPLAHVQTPAEVASALRMYRQAAKRLSDIKDGLETQAISLIQSGERIPGFTVEQGYGNKKWSKSPAEVIALGLVYELDLKKPDTCITPNQAVKLGLDKSLLSAYSSTPTTSIKLKPISTAEARRVFN